MLAHHPRRNRPLIVIVALLALGVAPAAQAKAAPPKFPYTYVNPDGSKTIIPHAPKRVVLANVQCQTGPDVIAALGIHPLGEGSCGSLGYTGTNKAGFPSWLNGGELANVTDTGFPTLDYEKVAALKPDLIVTQSTGPPATIAQLQAIAPVAQIYPGPKNFTAVPGNYGWLNELDPLAPIFNATDHVKLVLARLDDREKALTPFVEGSTLAVGLLRSDNQNFALFYNTAGTLTSIFSLAGARIEGPVPGTTAPSPNGFQNLSDEFLPQLTASKVIFEAAPSSPEALALKASPLYPKIPAAKTGHVYFTGWSGDGPIGTADAMAQLQKQVYGVSGLEATLAGGGTAKHRSSRSGVADVDVGPTGKRLCWEIATSGNVGRPRTAEVVDRHGNRLLALGRRFAKTGCTNVKVGTARQLLRSPGRYRVFVDTPSTTGILRGSLGAQTPAFFGNGDKPYTQ